MPALEVIKSNCRQYDADFGDSLRFFTHFLQNQAISPYYDHMTTEYCTKD